MNIVVKIYFNLWAKFGVRYTSIFTMSKMKIFESYYDEETRKNDRIMVVIQKLNFRAHGRTKYVVGSKNWSQSKPLLLKMTFAKWRLVGSQARRLGRWPGRS